MYNFELEKLPLSVFIITQNEEDRLPDALESVVHLASEIIIVDSGSTDKTIEIAKKYTDMVKFKKWEGFGQQKSYAESLCTYDWILNIDADEIVTKELAAEIRVIFQNQQQNNYDGYWLKIVEIPHFITNAKFYGRKKNYLRLYNKNICSYRVSEVHDSVITESENLGFLKKYLLHKSFKSYKHQIEKLNFYSDFQATDSFKKGKRLNRFKVIFILFIAFTKHYFVRKYFLYGIEGYIESWLYAFSRLAKYAKIIELERKNKQPNK
jgi:glycosyltransferase involved in cell wall biosynthesis